MKPILLSVLIFFLLLGCMAREGGFFDPGVDYKKLPDGSYMSLDTPRMWRDWMWSVDSEVLREVAFMNGTSQDDPLHGRPDGLGTWNGYWLSRIRSLQAGHHERPQKYIDYIIDRRRQAGLPELVGYP